MFGAELVIVLLAIYLGARLGGIGIGFAGGLGVLVLTLIFQIKPGAIPFDVIEIIMAVIAALDALFTLDAVLYVLLYLFGLAFSFSPLVKWCRENEGFSWPWPHVESEKKRIKRLRKEQEDQKK